MKTMQKANDSKGKKKAVDRAEALGAFKRITETTGILTWRAERKEAVRTMEDRGVKPDIIQQFREDEHPPDEELKARLDTDIESYRAFWDARLFSTELFDDGYGWLPECTGLVIGKEGTESILLMPGTAEMLILLTEDVVGYPPSQLPRLRCEVSSCFDMNFGDIAEAIPPLHDDLVSRLLSYLNGKQISDLILYVAERMEFPRFHGTDTVAKIARNLGEDRSGQILEVGNHWIIGKGQSAYRIGEALREHGGTKGGDVVEQLIRYMQATNDRLRQTLDVLRGGQDE